MLGLNELDELRRISEPGSEPRKALEEFIRAQRAYFAGQIIAAIRSGNIDEARKQAAMDLAYEELLALMKDFVDRRLKDQ